jgi:hypothetical protein
MDVVYWTVKICAQVGHGVFRDGRLRGEDFYGMEVAAEPPPAPPPHGLHGLSAATAPRVPLVSGSVMLARCLWSQVLSAD